MYYRGKAEAPLPRHGLSKLWITLWVNDGNHQSVCREIPPMRKSIYCDIY